METTEKLQQREAEREIVALLEEMGYVEVLAPADVAIRLFLNPSCEQVEGFGLSACSPK